LTFEPKYTDKNFVGDHLVKLILSDDLGASTSYLLKMKILPLINKGAPLFNPVPDVMSHKVALGETISIDFNYPTDDPDPEDNDIEQSFKGPSALRKFLTYDANDKILKCSIPLKKPPSITLNQAYSLKLILNDKNPAGARETTYTIYLEIYDPNPASSNIDV
jgi:hypothetical protein